VSAPRVDHDQVGLLADLERPGILEAQRAMPVGGRPLQHILGRGAFTVAGAYAFHEQPGAHYLDHIFRHVVGAHHDRGACRLQVSGADAVAAPRGDC